MYICVTAVYVDENSALDEHLLKKDYSIKKRSANDQPPFYDSVNRREGEEYYSSVADVDKVCQCSANPPDSLLAAVNNSFSRHYEVSPEISSSQHPKLSKRKNQESHSFRNPWSANGGLCQDQLKGRCVSVFNERKRDPYSNQALPAGGTVDNTQSVPALKMLYEFDERLSDESIAAAVRSQALNKGKANEMEGNVYSYALVGKIEVCLFVVVFVNSMS